ncbi:hypothetical protein EHQ16_03170 [Leptospira kanakyensis]|uniref:Transcriptional regulator n=1 Tax=Leptospira kanakyensis TaxID=2484968 RepID=A0A6N4PUH6_9LEPT|nr:hypothetical protein [Leptospira kanakyensis]TGK47530.1 hypothetical protein EHQ11_16465 [Leptospira kanakyensis]TGK63468.1 hypothetical protein EHQ16_03170 [Leptospira kanakyensis]TGK67071.1 hypothetical protein EHQ18_18405 [Leptospira kanakyensis]
MATSKRSYFIPKDLREEAKREISYRHGSISKWSEENKLSYNYLVQVLNGLAPCAGDYAVSLAKEGLIPADKASVSK